MQRKRWQLDFDEHLVIAKRGGEGTGEEGARVDRAMALRRLEMKTGVERKHDRRELGRGIGMREVAAECAAVADLRMGDVRHRLEEERRPLGDEL